MLLLTHISDFAISLLFSQLSLPTSPSVYFITDPHNETSSHLAQSLLDNLCVKMLIGVALAVVQVRQKQIDTKA